MMLSKEEIELAISILVKDKLPYSTPEEALTFADVKIISSNFFLLFIVNIPITTITTLKKLLEKLVRKDTVIDEFLSNNDILYAIVNPCKN